MPDERVSIIIRARDTAGRVLGRVTQNLGRMIVVGNQAVQLFGRIAAASVRAGARLVEFVTRGGKFINVQTAFTRVVGDSAAALTTLRAATRGLLSDYDLMVGLNQAIALGSAKSVAEFAELADVASELGRVLGLETSFALESLNTGIARQSRLRLDNIGIILSATDANKAYAAQLGKEVGALTTLEQKEAFRIAALEQARRKIESLGGSVGTAADKLNGLGVIFRNAVDRVSRQLAQSDFLGGILERVGNFASNIATIMNGQRDDIVALFRTLGSLVGNAFAEALSASLIKTSDLITKIPLVGLIFRLQRGINPAFRALQEANQAATTGREADLATLAGLAAAVQNRPSPPAAPRLGPGVGGGDLSLRDRLGQFPLAESARPDVRRFVDVVGGRTFDRTEPNLRFRPVEPKHVEQAEEFTDVIEVMGARLDEAAARTQLMQQVVGNAFAEMVAGVASGTQRIESAVLGMIANIAANIPGLGIFGQVGAGLLGVFSGLTNRSARDPLPVRVAEVDPRAAQQLERARSGPDRITLVVTDARGNTREIRHLLNRASRLDAIERVPVGVSL